MLAGPHSLDPCPTPEDHVVCILAIEQVGEELLFPTERLYLRRWQERMAGTTVPSMTGLQEQECPHTRVEAPPQQAQGTFF